MIHLRFNRIRPLPCASLIQSTPTDASIEIELLINPLIRPPLFHLARSLAYDPHRT